MKVMLVFEVDLLAMKEECSLESWIDYVVDEYGASMKVYERILHQEEPEKAWEQVCVDLATAQFAGGGEETWVRSTDVEVEYNSQERPDLT